MTFSKTVLVLLDFIRLAAMGVARSVPYGSRDAMTTVMSEYVPVLKETATYYRKKFAFTGHIERNYVAVDVPDKVYSNDQLSRELSYETAWLNGECRTTMVRVVNSNQKMSDSPNRTAFTRRTRRAIFGADDRLLIPVMKFAQEEPYNVAVRLSTGCSGVLVSSRHVLTAAHCIHDQKDYVEGYRGLKAGFLNTSGDFEWVDVHSTYIPLGWKLGADVAPRYDYALVRLRKRHRRAYLPLAISDSDFRGSGERIHFTSFEDDKPTNSLWFRSCSVEEDSRDVLYHYCDAKPGSSGSGVFAWDYDDVSKTWNRKVIGVFSGNRWRFYPEMYTPPMNFNAAIRLTAAKFAQVCKWMGPLGHSSCKVTQRKQG